MQIAIHSMPIITWFLIIKICNNCKDIYSNITCYQKMMLFLVISCIPNYWRWVGQVYIIFLLHQHVIWVLQCVYNNNIKVHLHKPFNHYKNSSYVSNKIFFIIKLIIYCYLPSNSKERENGVECSTNIWHDETVHCCCHHEWL